VARTGLRYNPDGWPPALMKQEGLFLDALGKVSKARMEGSKFLLANEDGSVELTFER
jgi:heat shock protein HslJ